MSKGSRKSVALESLSEAYTVAERRSVYVQVLGEAMFGATWKQRVADVLGYKFVTIHRWCAGDRIPSDEDVMRLRQHALKRVRQIAEAVDSVPGPYLRGPLAAALLDGLREPNKGIGAVAQEG